MFSTVLLWMALCQRWSCHIVDAHILGHRTPSWSQKILQIPRVSSLDRSTQRAANSAASVEGSWIASFACRARPPSQLTEGQWGPGRGREGESALIREARKALSWTVAAGVCVRRGKGAERFKDLKKRSRQRRQRKSWDPVEGKGRSEREKYCGNPFSGKSLCNKWAWNRVSCLTAYCCKCRMTVFRLDVKSCLFFMKVLY